MKIRITEDQLHMILSESMGVPDNITTAANAIVDDICDKYLTLLEDNVTEEWENEDFEELADELMDETGIDGVNVNGKEYYYGFFYKHGNPIGRYDYTNEAVLINYKAIENIVRKSFNCKEKIPEESRLEFVKTSLYERLLPIITHELTHKTNNEEAQGKYLGSYYKQNEEDLRQILYTFSENEMNARIGSVSGIVSAYIETTMMGIVPERSEFDEFSKEILYNNDLQLDVMMDDVDIILKRDLEGVQECSNSKEIQNYKQYSILYDLARNDDRLSKRRKLRAMFKSNSISAFNYVYRFYDNLLENYKKRLLRAIWYCWNQYQGDSINEQLLREYASPVLWHYTYIPQLLGILTSDSFKLSKSERNHYDLPGITGFSQKRPYYMCATRSKSTNDGYSRMTVEDNDEGYVRIELDGDKLNSVMHVKASDYFGSRESGLDLFSYGKRMMYKRIADGEASVHGGIEKFYRNSEDNKSNEREDTLWYNKPELKHAHRYITRIDVCVPTEESLKRNKRMLDAIWAKAEEFDIPIFFHDNEESFNKG